MTIEIGKRYITRGGRLVKSIAKRNNDEQPFEVYVNDYAYSVYANGMFSPGGDKSGHDILELDDDGEYKVGQDCVTKEGLKVNIERVCSWPFSEEDKAWYDGWAGRTDCSPSQTYCLYGSVTHVTGEISYLSWTRGGRYATNDPHHLDFMPRTSFEIGGFREAVAKRAREKIERDHAQLQWNSPHNPPPLGTQVYLTITSPALGGYSVIPAYCNRVAEAKTICRVNPKTNEMVVKESPLRFFSSKLDSTPIAPDIIVAWMRRPVIDPFYASTNMSWGGA